ncbi:hypothetical protein ABZ615_23940, partial [Streptomyces sp. NPDC007325]|uniref:hypothetical protein n=1 Tax=Streptomyces sp. NPDC007325 TaxID=3154588 RepID=UPI0033D0B42A
REREGEDQQQGHPEQHADDPRRAVEHAGALLSAELGLHPDLVFVSWPHPGTAATGAGSVA